MAERSHPRSRPAIAAAITLMATALAATAGAGQAMAGTGPSASASAGHSAATRSPSPSPSARSSSAGTRSPSTGSPSPNPSAGASTAAGASPSPSPSIKGKGSGYATRAHTQYLQSHATTDHMGRALPARRSASVSRAAVPLLSTASDPVYGDDVSAYQGTVNWSQLKANGGQFSIIKATEGTYYKNPDFSQQYSGASNVGMIRGAYAFAIPSYSSGASQADYFAGSGGGWTADGHTLPGVLDIEYNPYGSECYGLSQSAMVSWISSFVNEYHAKTGRWAVIYSTTDWWSTCTGNYNGFAHNDPLWIARYASSAGTLPAGWSYYTFWQYADSGTFPGDQDVFNGAAAQLQALANNK